MVDLSTNAILNRVPFNISSIEMNDPPTLTLYNFMSLLPENASIGALIARLQIFDPDTGIWGQVKLTRTDGKTFQKFPFFVEIENNISSAYLLYLSHSVTSDQSPFTRLNYSTQ